MASEEFMNATVLYQDEYRTITQELISSSATNRLKEWNPEKIHNLHQITTFDIVYLVFLSLTTMVGNVGNVMVIGAVMTHRPLRKEGNIFIVNLAIADLCVTAFVDPFSIAGTLLGHEFFENKSGLCHLIGSVCLVSCVCSLWSIAGISVNRFFLLCRPKLYRRIFSLKRTICIALGLWFSAFLLDLPNFLNWGDHTFDMKTMACSYDRLASYSYTVFFVTMFVAIPLLTVLFCNINIYIVVLQSKLRVAAHQDMAGGKPRSPNDGSTIGTAGVSFWVSGATQISQTEEDKYMGRQLTTFPAQQTHVAILHTSMNKNGNRKVEGAMEIKEVCSHRAIEQKSRAKNMRAEIKLAKTLFIIFIVFCVAWSPYAFLCLVDPGDTIAKEAYTISILLAHGSSTINSILYAFTNKSFRDGYKAFLFKICRFKLCKP